MIRRAIVPLGLVLATTLSGCMSPAAEPVPQGAKNGRLRVALNFAPLAELSPYTDDATSLMRLGVAEALISFDANGAPSPALAERFVMTTPSTATFTLRRGVTFHDGTPLDATAAAASLNHALKATPAPSTVSGRTLTITASGQDVVVTSAKPDPLLIMRFGNPDMVILAPKAYATNPNKPSPVTAGTGPFALQRLSGATEATLDAHAQYWGGTPAVRGLDVKFIGKADARVASLRAGESDVIQNVPIAQVGNLKDFQVDTRPIPRTTGLVLNTATGPFAAPGVRAAAARAINRTAVVASVFEGQADAAEGLFRSDVAWAAHRPRPALPPAAVPPATPITIATWNDRPELPEAITILADQLRQAGFTVNTPVVKTYAVLEPDLKAGKFDAVVVSRMYMSKANDPLSILESDFSCKGTYNLGRLCNPAIDAALASAAPLSDVARRRAAAISIERDVLSTAGFIPVLHERLRIGRTAKVNGLASDPLEWAMITHRTTLAP